MTENVKQLAQLHDDMLDQEMRLLEKAEELGTLRNRMYARRDLGLLEKTAKLAGELAREAEEYQEWLKEQLEKADGE